MGKLDDLEGLQKLKESGAITTDEFEKVKNKILDDDVEVIDTNNLIKEDVKPIDNKEIVTNQINRTCNKCRNELLEDEKFCGKCGNKVNTNNKNVKIKFNHLIIGIIIFILLVVGIILLSESRKVEVPNLVGMTVEQAKKTLEELNLNVSISSCGDIQETIATQNCQEGVELKEGSTIYITTKEKQQEQQKQQEENNKIKNTIEQYAKNMKYYNGDTIKYNSYSKYKVSSKGVQVYKIKYSTSWNSGASEAYYEQLVSLDENNEKVDKVTYLYYFIKSNSNGHISGDEYMVEYAYEDGWES